MANGCPSPLPVPPTIITPSPHLSAYAEELLKLAVQDPLAGRMNLIRLVWSVVPVPMSISEVNVIEVQLLASTTCCVTVVVRFMASEIACGIPLGRVPTGLALQPYGVELEVGPITATPFWPEAPVGTIRRARTIAQNKDVPTIPCCFLTFCLSEEVAMGPPEDGCDWGT